MFEILIVEDEKKQSDALEEFLRGCQKDLVISEIYCAPEIDIAKFILREKNIDLIICDLFLPDGNGIDVVKYIRKKDKGIPIIMLTGQPSVETAVTALKEGAQDYLQKPVDLLLLGSKIKTFLQSLTLAKENQILRSRITEDFQTKSIIGESESLKKLLEKVKQISRTDIIVLIEGESGTGKELIANVIHENSARKKNNFIKVNCGALTKSLLESELFGYVKGAFTGADKDRSGYFESANGGSLFLDEIAEMDLESQVRLLRVIEDRKVIRVGSSKDTDIDVRIIAATNKNLLNEVKKSSFREDLYYRLSVIKVEVPPLRQRISDLSLLFNHFLVVFNEKHDKSVTSLTPALRAIFENYRWSGNIREFKNLLEGMVIFSQSEILDVIDLPSEFMEKSTSSDNKQLEDDIIPLIALSKYERAIIKKNLDYFNSNRDKAAQKLGISLRTLYRKINEYNL